VEIAGNGVSSHGKVLESMKGLFLSPRLYLSIRVALGLVFMYAGFAKLLDPKAFAITVSHYDAIPQFLLAPFAVGLPVMELIAGLGLVINVRGSLAIVFALLVLFTLVLGYGVLNGMDIDCGCFSPEEIDGRNNIKRALLRDLLMIVAAFYLYMYRRVKMTTDLCRKNRVHYKEEEV
jgi:uncharacterized membrane protein YphA (DoxX/SURF4 family)